MEDFANVTGIYDRLPTCASSLMEDQALCLIASFILLCSEYQYAVCFLSHLGIAGLKVAANGT